MSTTVSGPKSSRRLVERFAAHLAHLLNTADGSVEVRPFALYRQLLQTLTSDGYRGLVGVQVAGAGRSPEEAAQRYFDSVLDRGLHLARACSTHKGHDLLLALCQRGADPLWEPAALQRVRHDPPVVGNAAQPHDFADVARRLGEVAKSISPGNPAASTQEKHGPLELRVGKARAEVAEELSIWKSITCAPTRLERLSAGGEFNAFCSLVIKAVEAANAPHGVLIALGLSPFDWEGEVSTNTLKKLSSFLSDVRAEGSVDELKSWRGVWKRRPVPGYGSVDDLWHSELGRAVRQPHVARQIDSIDIERLVDELVLPEPQLLDAHAFGEHLLLCRDAGVIDDFDYWLIQEIAAGKDIDDLARTPEVNGRLANGPGGLAAHVEELTDRALAWVQRHLDPRNGNRSHPDKDNDPVENRG